MLSGMKVIFINFLHSQLLFYTSVHKRGSLFCALPFPF
jgi:hypothetical protein